MTSNNVPKLRFDGFNEEWKQVKLGDIVEIKDSARISNMLWVSNGIPYLRSSDLVDSGISGKLFISNQTYQSYKEKTGAPEKDDVLFTSGGKVGVVYHKVDDNPVYVQGGSILYAKTSISSELSGTYLATFFSTPMMARYIDRASTGLTLKHFTLKPARNAPIFISSLKEQEKIGGFFNKLNDYIDAHQKELDTLKQTKQGFLKKIFPKEGESLPEIRFQGFTEDWKEIKAASIFQSVSDKNHIDLPVLSASQKEGMVFRNQIGIDIQYNVDSIKTYKRVTPGQFVIHLRSFQGGFALSNIEGITSPAYTVLDFKDKEMNSSLFWKNVLSSKNFIKRLETVTYGIRDGKSISFSDFSTLKFKVPAYEEQIQIGNFFKELDKLIDLQQQELDALKQTKKAFLQKMFV